MTDDLERERLIKKIPFDEKKVADALALAGRDITTARTILSHDRDFCVHHCLQCSPFGRPGTDVFERIPP